MNHNSNHQQPKEPKMTTAFAPTTITAPAPGVKLSARLYDPTLRVRLRAVIRHLLDTQCPTGLQQLAALLLDPHSTDQQLYAAGMQWVDASNGQCPTTHLLALALAMEDSTGTAKYSAAFQLSQGVSLSAWCIKYVSS